jgi:hypothetical protein
VGCSVSPTSGRSCPSSEPDSTNACREVRMREPATGDRDGSRSVCGQENSCGRLCNNSTKSVYCELRSPEHARFWPG